MDRLIPLQAAIDALDRIFDRCEEIEAHLPEGDPDRTGYKMYPDYMTVWKYLHQLPSAQPEQQWIPCKTRLPEDEGTYIVTDVDGDVEIAWYQEDWRDDKEVMAWFLDEYGWIEVLAWMPLPEPYKEEDNERA